MSKDGLWVQIHGKEMMVTGRMPNLDLEQSLPVDKLQKPHTKPPHGEATYK